MWPCLTYFTWVKLSFIWCGGFFWLHLSEPTSLKSVHEVFLEKEIVLTDKDLQP